MAKQVVIASSVTPREFNDSSQLMESTYDIPDIVQPTKRKGGDTDKVIIIPVEPCNFIMGHAHSAFVSTRSIDDMEDSLICDGGATYTLTKNLENCTQYKQKVVEIQTAHCATIENNAPLLQNLFCYRQTGRNQTNYCQSICGTRIEIRLAIGKRTQPSRLCSQSSSRP